MAASATLTVGRANLANEWSPQMRIKSDFTRKTVLFCCLGMLLCIAVYGTAAQPQSWYRNLTGQHLSLEEPPNIVRVGLPKDFPEVGVYTLSRTDGVWIVRLPQRP